MIPKMKESLRSMPPANPSPAERPARRRAKQKPAREASSAAAEPADLLTEIQFLKGLIEGLQREVAELKSVKKEHSNDGILPEESVSSEGSFGENSSSSIEVPAHLIQPDREDFLEPAPESEIFSPFEPQAFAQDFTAAFESPEPIDWGRWSEPDPTQEGGLDPDSWSSGELTDPALDEMVTRHPGLIEDVIAFNRLNPPDYEEESPFDKAVKRADQTGQTWRNQGSEALKLSEAPSPSVHDLMAELVAEASQSPAVSGAAGFESPLPDDLSGFAHDEATGYSPVHDSSFRQDDFSYAPASADQHPPKRMEADLIERVPAVAAIRACLLPLDLSEGVLRAGAPRPFDLEAIEEFESQTGLKVSLMPMPLEEVIQGLREGYSTRDEEEFRLRLLSGAAPSVPKTLMERASEFLPFLKRAK